MDLNGGSSFLPPINEICKRQMEQIPHMMENKSRKGLKNDTSAERIQGFDPKNMSMPEYSCKYHNEKNAGAYRHLLGSRVDGVPQGTNQRDLTCSAVHWQLDLRYYNPSKDKGSHRNSPNPKTNSIGKYK